MICKNSLTLLAATDYQSNMNRLKLTIKNDEGSTIFKMGSSVKAKQEYSDVEIADILCHLSHMIRHELTRDTAKTHKQLTFEFYS